MRQSSSFTPLDVLVFITIIIISFFSINLLPGRTGGTRCLVFIDSKPFRSVDLSSDALVLDTLLTVKGAIVITFGNGSIGVTHATCPGQICVNQGPISRPGQSIVCVPNRVFIVISAAREEWDGLSR